MIFFGFEQVIKLHSLLIAKTGGMYGLRDANLLDSTLKSPFQTFGGNELYPDIFDKAAQLCFSLICGWKQENWNSPYPIVFENKR